TTLSRSAVRRTGRSGKGLCKHLVGYPNLFDTQNRFRSIVPTEAAARASEMCCGLTKSKRIGYSLWAGHIPSAYGAGSRRYRRVGLIHRLVRAR
ncbi:MAG TPA: hypothetical protein VEB88_00070, partial [Candidatus Acidoferrales bacterium]|nr:hypothetical protein [Candidatus Acidoferrales bacterium]